MKKQDALKNLIEKGKDCPYRVHPSRWRAMVNHLKREYPLPGEKPHFCVAYLDHSNDLIETVISAESPKETSDILVEKYGSSRVYGAEPIGEDGKIPWYWSKRQ